MSIPKGWPTARITVNRMCVLWIARILGGRDVVRVGESEDEPFCMILGSIGGAIPVERSESTKEISVCRTDDSECGSFVVTQFVEISCCKSISKIRK